MKNANFIFAAVLVMICFLPPATQAQNWGPATPYPDPNSAAYCMAEMNNELYVAGEFTMIGGIVADYIAKWNGTSWSALGVGPSHPITCMTNLTNSIYAGSGYTGFTGIQIWNGSAWVSSLANKYVYDLCVYNGQILASTDSGVYLGSGQSWTLFGPGGHGAQICVYNNEVYLGNCNIGNGIAKWNGNAWIDVAGVVAGMPDILTMEVYNNRLVVGGMINSLGGITVYNIAVYDGISWSNVGFQNGFPPTPADPGIVTSLEVIGGRLYMLSVGGWVDFSFNAYGINSVSSWDGSQWRNEGTNLLNSGTVTPGDLIQFNGSLFVCGGVVHALDTNGFMTIHYLSKFNGSLSSAQDLITLGCLAFPNPVHDILTVTWSQPTIETLTLTDATGRAVRTYNVTGTQAQLSLEGLVNGVYFLSVGNETKSLQKIVKQ
jgi:hypothetical protein